LLRDACLVAGEWMAADSGRTIAVDSPSTGAVGNVPNMGTPETRRAIELASMALPAWRAKTPKERAIILRRWFDLMMTAEQGKPLAEAKGEAIAAADKQWQDFDLQHFKFLEAPTPRAGHESLGRECHQSLGALHYRRGGRELCAK
jgi:acyl-CoA reductase-like NAD-dependent aldehyde dehydrogenase